MDKRVQNQSSTCSSLKILAFYEIMAAKMRHAKLHDLFDAIKDRPSRPWHARLAMHAIM